MTETFDGKGYEPHSIQPLEITQISTGENYEIIRGAIESIETKRLSSISELMLLRTNVRCHEQELFIAHYRRSVELNRSHEESIDSLTQKPDLDNFATAFFIFDSSKTIIPLLIESIDSVVGIENGFSTMDCPPLIGKVIEKSDLNRSGSKWVSIKFNANKGLYEFSESSYSRKSE